MNSLVLPCLECHDIYIALLNSAIPQVLSICSYLEENSASRFILAITYPSLFFSRIFNFLTVYSLIIMDTRLRETTVKVEPANPNRLTGR